MSQPDILEPSSCGSGHGMLVPTGAYFCYAPGADGLVTAMVQWDRDAINGGVVARYYAPSEEHLAGLPTPDQPDIGERIYALQQAGRLFPRILLNRGPNPGYRIDDARPGYDYTYLVAPGGQPTSGPRLLPGTVYYFMPDEDAHAHPPLTDFGQVVALMSDPSVLTITDVGLLGDMSTDDPEVQQAWDLSDRVVVWDVGAVQRADDRRAH